jgi:hypothetical protein
MFAGGQTQLHVLESNSLGGSHVVLTHWSLQQGASSVQTDTHSPNAHISQPVQAWPQVPQFSWSLWVSTH